MRSAALIIASLALPAAPLHAATPMTDPVATAAAETPAAALKRLFFESDEAALKRNPVQALFRGDPRYADQFGDYITDSYYAGERAAADNDLQRLHAIDRAALNPTDQIAYDVFEWQTKITLRGLQPDLLALTAVRPIDHFYGFQVFYPDLASGQGAAPFKTLADYENNLKRHAGYVTLIDRAIARSREGVASGVVQPKLIVRNVIAQLTQQLDAGVEGSPFYGPLKAFPDGISPADQARLKTAYAAAISTQIFPAYVRLRDFLTNTYLPASRDSVGLSGMKGGAALYAYLIEENTTLPLKAAAIHTLGLSEVARITRQMDDIRVKTGFKGTLPAFFTFLRTSKQFTPASAEALHQTYLSIGKRVDARVPELFSTIPKTSLQILPVPAFREKTDAGGSYNGGTPDGSRPGIFYFNTYDLPSRYTWEQETLYLHEAIPGHHFQISLAQENADLPSFMRFGGNTAYAEGWALYSETLWPELGMETDPYQRMGGLNDEMLRAMRLVVDTGLHANGWTREQAIKYMLSHSSMSKTDVVAEVERYIAIPGQALAYKIGALTILRLKAKARTELGAKFDIRRFHAQVLMTGALPMEVLEKKINDWIKAGGV